MACSRTQIAKLIRKIVHKVIAKKKLDLDLRGVGSLSVGIVLGQAVNLLTIIFLTRYGSEMSIALLALFTANLAALAPLISLRFEIAYVVAETNADKIAFLIMSFCLSLLTVVALCLIYIFDVLSMQDFEGISLASFVVFIVALVLNNLMLFGAANLNSQSAYIKMAWILILQSVLCLIATIASTFWIGDLGAIVGLTFSYFVSSLMYFKFGATGHFNIPTLVHLKSTFKKFAHYPLISMPMAILNGYYHLVPIVFLTTVYSATEVAAFFLVHRFIGSPTAVLGTSLSNVLLKDFSVMGQQGRLNTFNKCALVLTFLAAFGMSFLFFLPESIYELLLGPIKLDKQIFLLLSASIFVRFVVSPLTMVLPAVGRVGLEAVWKLPSFLILAFFVIFLGDRSNFTTFVFQYVFLDIGLYFLYYLLCLIVVKTSK